jgi:predicted AAA+ superfamily ATPase
LIFKEEKRLGFEFKYTDSPKITKSMRIATEDLHLNNLTIIFPGKEDFPLGENIRVCGLETYLCGRVD